MKLLNPMRLSVGLAALFVAQGSWAAGTLAGTDVENTATLTYSVNSVPQTAIDSNTVEFKVDRKVDLNVTGTTAQQPLLVTPKSVGSDTAPLNVLTYTLTNEGNDDQAFEIDLSHASKLATADDFDADNCEFYVNELTPAPPPALETLGPVVLGTTSSLITLAPDGTAEIRVNCDMPDLGGAPVIEDGKLSSLEVMATAVSAAGTPMAESASETDSVVDTVIADADSPNTADTTGGPGSDGARNAKYAAVQTYEIQAPDLSAAKSSAVITDPFNCTTEADNSSCGSNTPKRIPGAIIKYTITVTNDSDDPATDVTITDILQSDLEYVGNETPAGEVSHSGGTVTATVDVPANSSTTITFDVKVK
ncbi:MAG: hypothetical protein R3F02_17965 [Thiolinea sp.]